MNLNETPLQRFQHSQFFEKHSEYIASQAFVEASKEAMMQMIQDSPVFSLSSSDRDHANCYQQIIGASRVLGVLRTLGIKQELDKPRRTDGLNYAAK